MPSSIEHLKAYIIVDNCFLVMLTDCFCDRFGSRSNLNQLVNDAEKWCDHILNVLKLFALDGLLHCSTGVANEYKPHAGHIADLRGVQRNDLNHLQTHVRGTLDQIPVDMPSNQTLRNLSAAPRKLIGVDGLSDNDLSLVRLALDITRIGSPVFILSNDQGLLDFITWIRIQKQQFQAPMNPGLIQGWRYLTYLELVHRSCNIESDLMSELIEFAFIDHYNRTEIAGTSKGSSIFQQLIQVHGNFNQSVVIKQQSKVLVL